MIFSTDYAKAVGVYGFVVTVPSHSIRVLSGCEVRIENAVTRVIVRHHEACRVKEFLIRTAQTLWILFLAYTSFDKYMYIYAWFCVILSNTRSDNYIIDQKLLSSVPI